MHIEILASSTKRSYSGFSLIQSMQHLIHKEIIDQVRGPKEMDLTWGNLVR